MRQPSALLIFDAGQARAAGGAEAVEAGEPFGLDERPQGFALGVEGFKLGGELLLAEGDAGPGFLMGGGKDFNLGAGLGEGGFLGLSAFEAGELFVFEAFGFGGWRIGFRVRWRRPARES